MPQVVKYSNITSGGLAEIDDHIRRLQMIREVAAEVVAHPELRPMLMRALASNGAPMTGTSEAESPQPSREKRSLTATLASLKGVRKEVYKHVPECDAVGATAREITEQMKHASYKFASKNQLLTAKEQLRELEKLGLVQKAGAKEDGSALWRRT